MKSSALGVVVVRLQVPELHAGHRYLLDAVTAIHNDVLVLIGETEARLTQDDPLTFDMRKNMLKAEYPGVMVGRIQDQPSDFLWSQELDYRIGQWLLDQKDPLEPVLYGGRDSFLKHYSGRCRTFELPPTDPMSGTEIRKAVEPVNSPDFRAGVIFASKHRYPTAFQCVDVVIYQLGHVLLGRKKRDGDKWRFIGGFVSPTDASLEAAAKREVFEEVGMEIGKLSYIGSMRVDDFRYPREGPDSLMSALFVTYPAGSSGCRAADDLDECLWFSIGKDIRERLVAEHQPLYDMLMQYKFWLFNDEGDPRAQ